MKTNTLYWILGLWLTFLAVMALTGCRTKSVTEYVAVHDTLRVLSHDTVTKTVTKTVVNTDSTERYHFHDITKMMVTNRERTVTLNEHGDTTRVNTDTHTWMLQSRRDSVGYYHEKCDSLSELVGIYKAKYDSLLSVKTDTHTREVIKQPSWWQRWGTFLAVTAVCLGLTLILKGKG